jgi:hypothetical protein
MAQERFLPFLPMTKQVDMQRLLHDVEAPPLELPSPTEEEARAMDQAFATQPEEPNTLLDGMTLAAAGMVIHDIVKDTLAAPEDEEDDPAAKPKNPDDESEPE